MTTQRSATDDVVTHVIRFCIEDKVFAEALFSQIATGKKRDILLPDGEITLTEEEAGEFVERFSSEVGPSLWESKRRKN